MREYDLVVFDWDGTLMDSTAAIVDAIRLSAQDLGLPVPHTRQAAWVIGLGLHDALRHAVPTLTPERLPAFVERYRHHYLRRDAELRLFDGARELLQALRDSPVPAAVATGKSRIGLERAFEAFGLRSFFVSSRCADEGQPKPHPWMLNELCEELGVEPARTLMIGDTTHDLQMAHAAGAHAVAVTWGAHDPAILDAARPHAVMDDMDALHRWIAARTGIALP